MKSHRTKKSHPSCSKKSRAKKIRRHRALPARWSRRAASAACAKSGSAPKPAPHFVSLDFPDRHLLYPHELADRMGCCIRHVYDLIAEGQLRAIDISGRNNSSDRRSIRVPIEAWRQFLNERTTQ
jgi:hypothetical protein